MDVVKVALVTIGNDQGIECHHLTFHFYYLNPYHFDN